MIIVVNLLIAFAVNGGDRAPKPLTSPFSKSEADKARAQWAAHLGIPERRQLDLGKGVVLDLILIPPGRFKMGSPRAERDSIRKQLDIEIRNETEREVTISQPFYLAVTETTQQQYEAILGWARNLSWFNPTGHGRLKGIDCAKYPVERVTWIDAIYFCEDLNERLGRQPHARLPSEAEWEYACRAGTTTLFHFGDKLDGRAANCDGSRLMNDATEKGVFLERTCPVASYPANAFGLFDMDGNVAEWCRDYYGEDTRDLAATDPLRARKQDKALRVLRGGAWDSLPFQCRSAHRAFAKPDHRDNTHGFRIGMPAK